MESIRSITFIACFLGIAIAMLDIVTPSEKTKKQVRLIFSLVFLIGIITPIMKADIDLKIPEVSPFEENEAYIQITNQYEKCVLNQFQENILTSLEQTLNASSIFPKEISLNVNIGENNCISISEVNIVLAVQDNYIGMKDEITKIIQKEVGIIPVNFKTMEVQQ